MENVRKGYMDILRDEEAEDAVNQLKNLNKESSILKQEFAKKVDTLNKVLEIKLKELSYKQGAIVGDVERYFRTIKEPHETGTMKKYKLANAELIMNKPSLKIAHNDVVIYQWAKKFKQYTKTVESLDWSSLKANIVIDSNSENLITKDTHETLNVSGLKVERVPEKFEIKY